MIVLWNKNRTREKILMKKPFSQMNLKHFKNGVMLANVRLFKKEKKDVLNKKKSLENPPHVAKQRGLTTAFVNWIKVNLSEWIVSNVLREACPVLWGFFFNKCKSIIRHTNGERVYDFFFFLIHVDA